MVKVNAFTMTLFYPQHCPSGDTHHRPKQEQIGA